jgi:aminomethyltransferase
MLGITLKGKDAITFLQTLIVGDIKALEDGTGTLSVFTNEKGGIIDDTVITKISNEEVYFVVNAGNRDKDVSHLKKHLASFSGDVALQIHDDRAILAFQGPEAVDVLQQHTKEDLSKLYFSMSRTMDIDGRPCFVTRTGYTGEDGFELSIPNDDALPITKKLCDDQRVRLAGLGPRDSLRLEAGLCLYGNDISDATTPVMAGLTWTIPKSRREACDFLGGEVIKEQLENGVSQRRVGFLVGKGAPARQHSDVTTTDGQKIGEITSGGHSPVLGRSIAMGYVDKAYAKAGTKLHVVTRGKATECETVRMPFVPVHYHKPQ